MTQSIETYLINLFVAILLVGFSSMAMGQVYQSPQHCVVDFTQGSGGGTGGGASGGMAGVTEDMGCIRPSYFFDTDTSASDWVWEIVEPTGIANYTNTRSINHNFLNQGTFVVSLTKTTNTNTSPTTVTETINVDVGTYPQRPMFNDKPKADTTVCGGKDLKLNPYKGTLPLGDYSYLWYPTGDTSRTIDVEASGCYSVEVTNNNTGCSRTASITVNFCLQPAGSGGGPEKWYFGNGATIEFETDFGDPIEPDSLNPEGDIFGTPQTDPNDITVAPVDNAGSNPLNSDNATAMVYGPTGALAFYTDGVNIYNGEDVLVTDLSGNPVINADPDASQGIVIVPKSNCNECPHHEYYVIYIDKDTKILTRASIDLRVNGGDGAITETNVPIAYPVTEKITAIKNSNETGFILISQEEDSNIFTFTSIDSSGTSSSTQAIGPTKVNDASYSGYIATDLAGNRIAVGYTDSLGQNFIEVYDFFKGDPTSFPPTPPAFVNRIEIPIAIAGPPYVYGIEFSENGDFLYITLRGDPAKGDTSYLLQLPLILGDPVDIAANTTIIDQSNTEAFGALKLGPVNGPGRKFIYMAIDGVNEVPFIQQPDIRGGAADIGYTRVTSSIKPGVEVSGTSQAGLPNVVFANQEQSGDGISATYNGNCFMASTALEIQDVCSPLRNQIEWEFEDGTVIKGSPIAYTFPKLGWNKIKATIKIYNTSPLAGLAASNPVLSKAVQLTESVCEESVILDSIYIKPSPVSNLAEITYLCFKDLNADLISQDSIFLNPRATGGDTISHEWFTAIGTNIGRDTILKVAAPSVYKLELTNEFDCLTKDETDARDGCEPKILLPTAITPNGDGLNESLKVIYAHIENYNMQIFNRWGELVHDSEDPEIKWDGRVKGRVQSPTVYPYIITYYSKDFPERGILRQKGTVWVLQ